MNPALFSTRTISYIALSVAILAICSWISIPLLVPVTLQTMAVFLISGLLGTKRALMALTVYVLLGAVGAPVFSGFAGGLGVLLGPTGGYIFGFFFIAICVGFVRERMGTGPIPLAIGMVAGLLLCYLFGTLWFQYVYTQRSGPIGLWTVLSWCVFPFIIPDMLKMGLALTIVQRLGAQLKIR